MLSTTQSQKIKDHLLNIDKSFTFFTCSVYELLTRQMDIPPSELKKNQIDSFYTPYQKAFDESSELGRDWLDTTYPHLKTVIGSTISETADMHKEIANLCSRLLDPYEQHEEIPEEVAKDALQYISALQDILKEKRTILHKTYDSATKKGTLYEFNANLRKAAEDMHNAASDKSVSSENLSKDMQELTDKIASEKAELVKVGNEMVLAGAAIPATLTIGIVSVALAPFTFGGTLAIGAATAVVEGASIGGLAYLANKQASLQADIYAQTKQIKVDDLIVHFARDIRTNASEMDKHLASMETLFSNIISIFANMEEKLNAIIDNFSKSKRFVKTPNLEAIYSKNALKYWNELVKYAQCIQFKEIQSEKI